MFERSNARLVKIPDSDKIVIAYVVAVIIFGVVVFASAPSFTPSKLSTGRVDTVIVWEFDARVKCTRESIRVSPGESLAVAAAPTVGCITGSDDSNSNNGCNGWTCTVVSVSPVDDTSKDD